MTTRVLLCTTSARLRRNPSGPRLEGAGRCSMLHELTRCWRVLLIGDGRRRRLRLLPPAKLQAHVRAQARAPCRSSEPERSRSRSSRCPGCPARSLAFSSGISTVLMPPRCAASSFSFRPPIGSTSPRSVISPVIATSARTGMPVSADTKAVVIAAPGARAVLGRRAVGHVDVDVALLEQLVLDAQATRRGCAPRCAPPRPIPSSRRRASRCG